MASPYTKDITKSAIYRKVTGQSEKPIDQFLEGMKVLKNYGKDKLGCSSFYRKQCRFPWQPDT